MNRKYLKKHTTPRYDQRASNSVKLVTKLNSMNVCFRSNRVRIRPIRSKQVVSRRNKGKPAYGSKKRQTYINRKRAKNKSKCR